MSDHENNPDSPNEQDAPVTPTTKRALAIVDSQSPDSPNKRDAPVTPTMRRALAIVDSQSPDSPNEQDAPGTPTMRRAFAIVDGQSDSQSPARANRSSATPLPTKATLPSPSPIPVGSTQRSSPFIWPQPRGTPTAASETVDAGTRRIPEALRNAPVAGKSSMCIFQSDASIRDRANTFKGTSSAPATPMIDQREGGGFLNAEAGRPKTRKMQWTAENDRSLLLFGFGRDISGVEYKAIADWFKEKPTAKAVQERLTKLRAAGRKVLKESGIFDADAPRITPNMSRAPSVVQTPAPSKQLRRSATPATPTTLPTGIATPTPAPGPRSLGGQSLSQTPSRRSLTGSPVLPDTLTLTTGLQNQQPTRTAGLPSHLPSFTGTGMTDDMGVEGMHGSTGAQMLPGDYPGVRQQSSTPFPRGLTAQEQDESLERLYSRLSQQHASNTTGVAGANVGGPTGENTDHDSGEGVDELRRSEMLDEAMRARWQARKARRDEEE
jgi:hypothetical protein